jgi:transcription antitermination factor NusG
MNSGSGQNELDISGAWCAIYTRHQHEKAIAEILSAKGLEVFLPLYNATRRWKDRTMHLSLPLFPCYLFLRGMKERRLEVVTTPGIVSVLSINGEPAAIPESEIESVRRAIEWGNRVEPHPFLRCGDRVRVISGPLQGLEGILVRKKNFYRLVLSVEMLERSAAVEVDVSAVERVANRPPTQPWGPEPGINVGSVGRASRP